MKTTNVEQYGTKQIRHSGLRSQSVPASCNGYKGDLTGCETNNL